MSLTVNAHPCYCGKLCLFQFQHPTNEPDRQFKKVHDHNTPTMAGGASTATTIPGDDQEALDNARRGTAEVRKRDAEMGVDEGPSASRPKCFVSTAFRFSRHQKTRLESPARQSSPWMQHLSLPRPLIRPLKTQNQHQVLQHQQGHSLRHARQRKIRRERRRERKVKRQRPTRTNVEPGRFQPRSRTSSHQLCRLLKHPHPPPLRSQQPCTRKQL